jgi:hypothetical protein
MNASFDSTFAALDNALMTQAELGKIQWTEARSLNHQVRDILRGEWDRIHAYPAIQQRIARTAFGANVNELAAEIATNIDVAYEFVEMWNR